jgi:hypothetical protein
MTEHPVFQAKTDEPRELIDATAHVPCFFDEGKHLTPGRIAHGCEYNSLHFPSVGEDSSQKEPGNERVHEQDNHLFFGSELSFLRGGMSGKSLATEVRLDLCGLGGFMTRIVICMVEVVNNTQEFCVIEYRLLARSGA